MCRCTLEKGALGVALGSQVVMKGKKIESQYELTGSTIEGSVSSVSSSIKEANHT